MNDDERRRERRWAERQNNIWGGPGLWTYGCLGNSLLHALAVIFLVFAFFLLIYWLT